MNKCLCGRHILILNDTELEALFKILGQAVISSEAISLYHRADNMLPKKIDYERS